MSNEEIWKDIEGYEGYYQVSNMGRVKSLDRVVPHGRCGTITRKEKILKHGNSKGYDMVVLCVEHKRKAITVHKLVAEAFISKKESHMQVNHIDGNPKNNVVSNLEWCTSQENTIHALKNNIIKNKFSKKEILEIKHKYNEENVTRKELAKQYSVNYSSIYRIISGESYNFYETKER